MPGVTVFILDACLRVTSLFGHMPRVTPLFGYMSGVILLWQELPSNAIFFNAHIKYLYQVNVGGFGPVTSPPPHLPPTVCTLLCPLWPLLPFSFYLLQKLLEFKALVYVLFVCLRKTSDLFCLIFLSAHFTTPWIKNYKMKDKKKELFPISLLLVCLRPSRK